VGGGCTFVSFNLSPHFLSFYLFLCVFLSFIFLLMFSFISLSNLIYVYPWVNFFSINVNMRLSAWLQIEISICMCVPRCIYVVLSMCDFFFTVYLFLFSIDFVGSKRLFWNSCPLGFCRSSSGGLNLRPDLCSIDCKFRPWRLRENWIGF
jgi:hypothetical protein